MSRIPPGPKRHMSYSGTLQPDDTADDLNCPVCLELFDDPCFVCQNHHTLCRGCYDSIVRRTGFKDASCPQCREFVTRPVENSQMRRLVEAHEQTTVKLARCQAAKGKDSSKRCAKRAFSHCGHCDRDLCDLHFSEDRLEFQAECEEQLSDVDEATEEANAASLTAWNSFIEDSVKLLRDRQRGFQWRPELPTSLSTLARAEAVALRRDLKSGDLRAAKATCDRLTKATDSVRNRRNRHNFWLPGARQRIQQKLRAALDEMEKLVDI